VYALPAIVLLWLVDCSNVVVIGVILPVGGLPINGQIQMHVMVVLVVWYV